MRYVALLRGINVGGNNIIPMKALAASVAKAGYTNVSTYIASGNVLFDGGPDGGPDKDGPDNPRAASSTTVDRATSPQAMCRAIETRLERVLGKAFDYEATVVVRSRDEMAAMIAALPKGWTKPRADTRYYVLFLRHTIDAPPIVERLGAKPGIETLTYHPGTVFWSAKIATIAKSGVAKGAQRAEVYPHITVRNLNTTKKLASLAVEDRAT